MLEGLKLPVFHAAFAALDVTDPQQLFTHCCDLIPGRSDFRKERFLVAHSPRMQSVMVGRHGRRNVRQLEAEREERGCSAHFPLMRARTPACRVLLTTFRAGLSPHSLWKDPHRYT